MKTENTTKQPSKEEQPTQPQFATLLAYDPRDLSVIEEIGENMANASMWPWNANKKRIGKKLLTVLSKAKQVRIPQN